MYASSSGGEHLAIILLLCVEGTMQPVLIVEDNGKDLQQATTLLREMGAQEVQATTSVAFALEYLRDVAEGKKEIPGLLILDLEFSSESGFEVLRYWKSTPSLKKMPVVVWTVMGDVEQRLSEMFGVERVVDKKLGIRELEKVLKGMLAAKRAS